MRIIYAIFKFEEGRELYLTPSLDWGEKSKALWTKNKNKAGALAKEYKGYISNKPVL